LRPLAFDHTHRMDKAHSSATSNVFNIISP
jgi:hypothetical protein